MVNDNIVFVRTFENNGSTDIGRQFDTSSFVLLLYIGVTFAIWRQSGTIPTVNDKLNIAHDGAHN